MIGTILSWVTGGSAAKIIGEIVKAQERRRQAKNESERIQAETEIAYLEAKRDVIMKEQGNAATRLIRPLFALPFVIYNIKVIVYDKVLGLGSTDMLSPEFWQLQMIVFGTYFLTRPFDKKK